MHIVFLPLSHTLFRTPKAAGGDRTHIIEFANALAKIPKIRVTLLYPDRADCSQLRPEVRLLHPSMLLGSEIPETIQLMSWNARASRMVVRLLRRLARQDPADAFYVRFAASSLLPLVLLRSRCGRRPLIVEVNTPAFMNVGGIVGRLADRAALALADRLAVVSEDLKELMAERYGRAARERIFVNPNGADPERFKPLGSVAALEFRREFGLRGDDFVIGYSGVALPHHRLEIIARCVGHMDPQCRLAISGAAQGVDLEQIASLAPGRVLLVGQLPYARQREFLNACDVLVLPHGPSLGSRLHQSPIKLFEYMAMAKPVVASRIGQIAHVIRDRENGRLFDWQREGELLECLSQLQNDGALRHRLGQSARRTVIESYTWEMNARRVLDALRLTLDASRVTHQQQWAAHVPNQALGASLCGCATARGVAARKEGL